MVTRPVSIPEARRAMREGRDFLHNVGMKQGLVMIYRTACENRPVPFSEVRQTPDDAAALCGRGTDAPCPLLERCVAFGFTESVYADDMVYGGYTWRRGLPLVSQDGFNAKRGRRENRLIRDLTSA